MGSGFKVLREHGCRAFGYGQAYVMVSFQALANLLAWLGSGLDPQRNPKAYTPSTYPYTDAELLNPSPSKEPSLKHLCHASSGYHEPSAPSELQNPEPQT